MHQHHFVHLDLDTLWHICKMGTAWQVALSRNLKECVCILPAWCPVETLALRLLPLCLSNREDENRSACWCVQVLG